MRQDEVPFGAIELDPADEPEPALLTCVLSLDTDPLVRVDFRGVEVVVKLGLRWRHVPHKKNAKCDEHQPNDNEAPHNFSVPSVCFIKNSPSLS